jgi:hypothetical protein
MASEIQVMMTLAALAYTDEAAASAAESVADQEERILYDLNTDASYGLTQVATTSDWEAVWVGLSSDTERSNLTYIARSSSVANTYAVAVRGSDFGLFMDSIEDFDVSATVPFGGGAISVGAEDAYSKITTAVCAAPSAGDLQGMTLFQALHHLVEIAGDSDSPATIYVTGHSLGGAIASAVSLGLVAEQWENAVVFQVYTYAAPTAGTQTFADAFDAAFNGASSATNSSWRVVNAYDVVPNAWQSIDAVEAYYPNPPGPAATFTTKLLLRGVALLANGNAYVQPNRPGSGHAIVLNSDYRLYDPGDIAFDLNAFFGQLGYQHGCDTYLQLLGAPTVRFKP